jgi:hypothetical protein
MLSREEIEQMINQKIEPNMRQSLGRIETTQNSLKLDLERQEKRSVRFEQQTNDQLTELKADTTTIKEQLALAVGK